MEAVAATKDRIASLKCGQGGLLVKFNEISEHVAELMARLVAVEAASSSSQVRWRRRCMWWGRCFRRWPWRWLRLRRPCRQVVDYDREVDRAWVWVSALRPVDCADAQDFIAKLASMPGFGWTNGRWSRPVRLQGNSLCSSDRLGQRLGERRTFLRRVGPRAGNGSVSP